MPFFSIIMPVYNSEKYLKQSIDSVLKQTVNDFELIVIDDGSTDSSSDIIKDFASKDSRVVSVFQKNAGPGAARNNGLKRTHGTYIAFLDSDDYWENDFLDKISKTAQETSADLIYVNTRLERTDRSIIRELHFEQNEGLPKEVLLRYQLLGKLPWGMSKVVKRELLQKVNQQFMAIKVGEESLFSFDILRNANKVAFEKSAIYHYVQHGTGQHTLGSYDPWGPMVNNIKEYLLSIGEFDVYESTINSLALKALAISVYRSSFETKMTDSLRKIRDYYSKYSMEYDFKNIDKELLDRNTKIIYLLLKYRFSGALLIASRIRKRKLAY